MQKSPAHQSSQESSQVQVRVEFSFINYNFFSLSIQIPAVKSIKQPSSCQLHPNPEPIPPLACYIQAGYIKTYNSIVIVIHDILFQRCCYCFCRIASVNPPMQFSTPVFILHGIYFLPKDPLSRDAHSLAFSPTELAVLPTLDTLLASLALRR